MLRLILALTRTVEKLDHGMTNLGEFGSHLLQDLRSHAFAFADETQEDVFGPDVVVTELQCFSQRKLENFFRPRGEGNVPTRCLRPPADDLDHLIADADEVDIETFESASGDPFTLVEETEEDVLGSDVAVIEKACFFLSEDDYSSCPVGKALKHSQYS